MCDLKKRSLSCLVYAFCLGSAVCQTAPVGLADDTQLAAIQRLIQSAELPAARDEIKRSLQQSPADPRLYNFLGVVAAQERKFSESEAGFQHAIEIAPGFAGAYLNLGRLYQEEAGGRREMLDKALNTYYNLLRAEPANLEGNYQAALLLSRTDRFRPSLQYLGRLPVPAQHRSPALALLCANNAGLGLLTRASTAASELRAAPDLSEVDVLPITRVLISHHASQLAAELLEALADRGLGSAAVYEQLANISETEGNFRAAREALAKELEAGPKPTAPLLNRLARLAYRAGDREGALGYLAHARDLEPANPATHFLFGLICIELKLPPEASDSLRQAVRLDPANPYYNYALAAVLLQQHKPEEAIVHFQNFQKAKPEDARGHLALGVAYFDAEQASAASKELRAAAASPDTEAAALLYLSRLAVREGALDEAVRLLEQAVRANPKGPQAYIELAQVTIRRSQYEPARKALDQALRLSPDNFQANLNLLLLYRRTHNPLAEKQAELVAKLREADDERERMLLRSLDIHPY